MIAMLMSNRHLKSLYLHSNGTDATVVYHKFFSLWYSERVVDIKAFKGVRHLFNPAMHLYQLDYEVKGWFKNRDTYLIFRPQFVYDKDIWRQVRLGHYIRTEEYSKSHRGKLGL